MLADSRVVMLWRRVSSLDSVKAMASGMNLPLVGEDSYSVMYDAGGLLVGYWVQDQKALVAAGSCSGLNFVRYEQVVNPASELVLTSANMESAMHKLGEVMDIHMSPITNKLGSTLPFFDDAGNLTSFYHPSATAFDGAAGAKLRILMRNRGIDNDSADLETTQQMGATSIRLMVSQTSTSERFYRDVLGLRNLQTEARGGAFDVGTVILSTISEPMNGLVKSLSRSKQLLQDWIIFHTKDIYQAQEGLQKKGITFPAGIEESEIGLMAYFQDPDGHSLVLWQPPVSDANLKINFFPVLDRILNEKA
jgi:predicted enzyme related to lactoylglutathione lyase